MKYQLQFQRNLESQEGLMFGRQIDHIEGDGEVAHMKGGTIGSQSTTAREIRLEEVGLWSVVETSDLVHSLVGSTIAP